MSNRSPAASVPDETLPVLALAIPLLLAIVVYANTLHNPFLYDDRWTIERLRESSGIPWWSITWRGRELTYALHRLNLALWGEWPPGFHAVNIGLHGVACVLSALTAFALTRSARCALLCGSIFAVHPVHVEAVASFAYRKDVLATVFALTASLAWLRSKTSLTRYCCALVGLVGAFLSKEVVGAGLVPMLVLAEGLLWDLRAPSRQQLVRSILRLAPIAVIGGAAIVLLAGEVGDTFRAETIEATVDPRLHDYQQVAATALSSVLSVSRLLVFPVTLSADYSTHVERGFFALRPMLGALIIAVWVVVAVRSARRQPVVAFAMAWTLFLYLPSSNFVPLTKFFVAERYLYAPSFGVCLLAALASARWLERGRARRRGGVVIVLLAALSARCIVRNLDWVDDRSLWTAAVTAGADTYRAHTNLAYALKQDDRIEEAIVEYRAAAQLNPAGHRDLGIALAKLGRLDEAIAEQRAALTADPSDTLARAALAAALAKNGKLDDAIEEYRRLLRSAPDNADAHGALGTLLARVGRAGEGLMELEWAVRLKPHDTDAVVNMANVLRVLRRYPEAVLSYRKALAIADSADAMNNLAWLLATCPELDIRNAPEAVRLARRACQLSGNGKPAYMFTLSVAEASAGNRNEAARVAREGLIVARSRGEGDLARLLDELLRTYAKNAAPNAE